MVIAIVLLTIGVIALIMFSAPRQPREGDPGQPPIPSDTDTPPHAFSSRIRGDFGDDTGNGGPFSPGGGADPED